jgi:soluble lytic murein transglycosylase-like protein
LQATFAWIRHRQGLTLKATERFPGAARLNYGHAAGVSAVSGGRRASSCRRKCCASSFRSTTGPLITKYSEANGLDPYLIAALMAQESTFTPEIRSDANAYGLLQITPPTGRMLARQLGLRYTTSMLTQAETNVRMGYEVLQGSDREVWRRVLRAGRLQTLVRIAS